MGLIDWKHGDYYPSEREERAALSAKREAVNAARDAFAAAVRTASAAFLKSVYDAGADDDPNPRSPEPALDRLSGTVTEAAEDWLQDFVDSEAWERRT